MSTTAQNLRMDIRAREEEQSRLLDERKQLEDRIDEVEHRREELGSEIDHLRTALAIVQEQVTTSTPVVVPEPVPVPVPEPESVDPDPTPIKPTEKPTRASNGDSLTVNRHPQQSADRKRPVRTPRPRHWMEQPTLEDNPDLAWDKITDMWRDRAELVIMILEDGECTQQSISKQFTDGLITDCDEPTAHSITSRCIKILTVNHLILYTGKTENRSPIWKLTYKATPDELAAAGLAITDDNYAGTTTRWPVRNDYQFIRIESNAFEQGKR